MNRPAPVQQEGDALLCDTDTLAAVDLLLTEASARLEQLPGLPAAAAQHIVASAQAIVRHELDPDEQRFCPVALSEARAAVVAATYAARHIHDANLRGRGFPNAPHLEHDRGSCAARRPRRTE